MGNHYMKISALIICLLLFCSYDSIKAQGLTPSTVRQIFSLEKGDSLEYHVWTVANGCGTICNWYELKVVDSVTYSISLDTLFISFQSQVMRFDSGAPVNCGQCQEAFQFWDICAVSSDKWSFTNLDSSIIYYLDTTYGKEFAGITDSIYYGMSYSNSKQNLYRYYQFNFNYYGTDEIYADSIGIVYKEQVNQLPLQNREQLIYYHKANGKLWGEPYIVSGIANDLKEDSISVYPNPVDNNFVIHSSQYQGLRFKLFDALSKQVMTLNLSASETEVSRNNLSGGIYFWQITSDGTAIKTGKLIMD